MWFGGSAWPYLRQVCMPRSEVKFQGYMLENIHFWLNVKVKFRKPVVKTRTRKLQTVSK